MRGLEGIIHINAAELVRSIGESSTCGHRLNYVPSEFPSIFLIVVSLFEVQLVSMARVRINGMQPTTLERDEIRLFLRLTASAGPPSSRQRGSFFRFLDGLKTLS